MGLSQLLQVPVRIRHLTVSPNRVTLHQISIKAFPFHASDMRIGTPPFLLIDRVRIHASVPLLFKQAGHGSLLEMLESGIVESVIVKDVSLSLSGVSLWSRGLEFFRPSPNSQMQCEGWFLVRHPFLSGHIELSGALLSPVFLGWLEIPSDIRRHFVGQAAVTPSRLVLSRLEITGGWSASGSVEMPSQVTSSTYSSSTEHRDIRGDLRLVGPLGQCDVELKLPSIEKGEMVLNVLMEEGEDRQKITGAWRIGHSRLHVKMDFFEDQLELAGDVSLKSPYPMDFVMDFKGVGMDTVASFLLPKGRTPTLAGSLHGRVDVDGPLHRLVSRGDVTSHNGRFGSDRFERAVLHFEGAGPILQIANSQLTKPTGVLLIDGAVDLRRFGQSDFFSNIRLSSLEQSLGVSGWEVVPSEKSSGLKIKKGAPEKVSVSFAYGMDDRDISQEPVVRKELEVSYPLNEQQRLRMKLDREDRFLGVEHRGKF